MADLHGIVQKVLAGQTVLDVATVHQMIESTIDDKVVDLQSELKPLEDLFEGGIGISVHANFAEVEELLPVYRNYVDSITGKRWTQKIREPRKVDPEFANRSIDELLDRGISGYGIYTLASTFKAGVRSTVSGKRLLESFVYGAEKLHQSVGDSRSKKVRKLDQLAVRNAAHALGDEELIDLLRKYEGALDGHQPSRYECTHAHLSPHDVDGRINGAYGDLMRYLEQGFWTRTFMSEEKKDAMEHDPMRSIREYLEGHYEPAHGG